MRLGGLTEVEFSELPALLRRGLFMQITGLSEKDLAEGIRAGEIQVRKAHARGKMKFYKWQAEQMARPGTARKEKG